LRPFSDLGGRYILKLDNSTIKRQELAIRLRDIGCRVDLSGTDWHTVGDFSVRENMLFDSQNAKKVVVNEEMINIMEFLSTVNDGASIFSIKYATKILLDDGTTNFLSEQRIQYYLEKLLKIGYVQRGQEMSYELTEDGREYLYKKGII